MSKPHSSYRLQKEDLEFFGRIFLLMIRILYYLILIYSLLG